MSRDPPLYFTSLLFACYMRPKAMKPQDQAMDLALPAGAGTSERADPAIEVEALTKQFKGLIAVDRVSFSVARGSVTGLLGGNGAGKSTTIGMIMGLILPTSGKVRVLGTDMLRERYRVLARMNFESPYVDMPHRLSVRQNLEIFARLYGVGEIAARIGLLAKELALEDLLDRRFGQLSDGQKTRVALAKALINEPDVLLLDEPTASLDPDTADWVRTHIENYQRGKRATILLASHNMLEVERLCDRVIMLKEGRIVGDGSPDELLARFERSNLEEVFLDLARGRRQAQ
jgi:ABC-2 type transport system ATP-binding protein